MRNCLSYLEIMPLNEKVSQWQTQGNKDKGDNKVQMESNV